MRTDGVENAAADNPLLGLPVPSSIEVGPSGRSGTGLPGGGQGLTGVTMAAVRGPFVSTTQYSNASNSCTQQQSTTARTLARSVAVGAHNPGIVLSGRPKKDEGSSRSEWAKVSTVHPGPSSAPIPCRRRQHGPASSPEGAPGGAVRGDEAQGVRDSVVPSFFSFMSAAARGVTGLVLRDAFARATMA
jgi:hypothetical protein